jgi:hypothetical protein
MEIQSQTNTASPFISIWTKPRETIRQIVETDPKKYVIVLAMLAGISQTLDRLSTRNYGDSLPVVAILAIGLVLGPIAGIISLYFGGALYRWSGSLLGGQASPEEVRAAIAWSSVPTIFALPLWIPQLLIFGQELFTRETPKIDANPILLVVLLSFAFIEIVMGIWGVIVLLKCLGEVNKFSAWKALGSLIIGSLIILIPIICILVSLSPRVGTPFTR